MIIRINLLPVSDTDRLAQGRLHLIVFVGVLLFVIALLGLVFMATSAELDELRDIQQQTRAAVAQLERDSAETERLKRDVDALQKQLDVLEQLKQGRTGPVRMLDELKAMLNKPRDEEDRFAQMQNDWNVEWDPSRLWLEEFQELAPKQGALGAAPADRNSSFLIKGSAINHDDVAEFLQRMGSAEHFYDIQLDEVVSSPVKVGNKQIPKVTFGLKGKLSYLGKSKELALPPPPPAAQGAPQ